jgi:hypothetical protein
MLPALVAAAPAIISGISRIFGNKRAKKQEGQASEGLSQLVELFKSQLGQDYFDSAEAKGAVNAITANEQENLNQIDAAGAINGLTDEAKISMKGKQNKATASAFADLSRSANLWKQRNQQMYQSSLGQLFGVGQKNRQNFNDSISNIVQPLQSSVDGAMNAGLFDN